MARWCSNPLNCLVTSKWQEASFSSVSSVVPDGKISLENVWHIIGTQNFWKECIDEIPLAAPSLPPMLVAWILGICGRVKYMSILSSSEAQLSLCSLCLPVHKTFSMHLETWRKDPASLHMKFAALSFCTCGLSDLEYICVSRSQLEQWDLTFRRQRFVESLFLVLFKSCTHCKSRSPLPTEGWRNVPWSQV